MKTLVINTHFTDGCIGKVTVSGSTFDIKDELNNAGFKFQTDSGNKVAHWHKTYRIVEDLLEEMSGIKKDIFTQVNIHGAQHILDTHTVYLLDTKYVEKLDKEFEDAGF